jgi:hypothetical protein
MMARVRFSLNGNTHTPFHPVLHIADRVEWGLVTATEPFLTLPDFNYQAIREIYHFQVVAGSSQQNPLSPAALSGRMIRVFPMTGP